MPKTIPLKPAEVAEALVSSFESKTRAAALLGISPATLRRWLKARPNFSVIYAAVTKPGAMEAEQLEHALSAGDPSAHDRVIESRAILYQAVQLRPMSIEDAEAFLKQVKSATAAG